MILGLVLAPVSAAKAAADVLVCVEFNNVTSLDVLASAQALASRMFATAGVALEWHLAGHAACQGPQPVRTIVLDFVRGAPASQNPEAMAYAKPYEAIHAVVLVDRLERVADGPGQMYKFLAHMMTHEITHLLQGILRHSQTGVMKARWDANDLMQMAYTPLPFTAEDTDLIQRGLRRRAASAGGPASPER